MQNCETMAEYLTNFSSAPLRQRGNLNSFFRSLSMKTLMGLAIFVASFFMLMITFANAESVFNIADSKLVTGDINISSAEGVGYALLDTGRDLRISSGVSDRVNSITTTQGNGISLGGELIYTALLSSEPITLDQSEVTIQDYDETEANHPHFPSSIKTGTSSIATDQIPINSSDSKSIRINIGESDAQSESNNPRLNTELLLAQAPTLPVVSIANNVNYIAEGSNATFTVTATELPAANIGVNVEFTVQGDFIGTGESNNSTKLATFTPSGDKTVTVSFKTKVDTPDGDSHGLVTATLTSGTGYNLTTTMENRTASIAVIDELPVISLSTRSFMNEADGKFTITLASNFQPLPGRNIKFTTLTAQDSNALPPSYNPQIPELPILITNANYSAVEVVVTITKDPLYHWWDLLNVIIEAGDEYSVNSDASFSRVIVREEQLASTIVSVEAPDYVFEGDDFIVNLTTEQTITGEGFYFNLEVPNAVGNPYVDPATFHIPGSEFQGPTFIPVNLSRSPTEITIKTLQHNGSTDGQIELVLPRGDGFEPDSTKGSKTVIVQERDLLPKVSIGLAGTVTTFDEGEDVTFEISASVVTPSDDSFTAYIQLADDDTHDFLADATTTNQHEVILSSGGTNTLVIPTVADAIEEGIGGTITATVQPDPNLTDSTKRTAYLLSTTNPTSVGATITDNDGPNLPSVTISANSISITEGEMAQFTLNTTATLTEDLVVTVRFSEVGAFITRDLATASTTTYTIPFMGTNAGSFVVVEPSTDDNFTEKSGSITAQILSDPETVDKYGVGEQFSATVQVLDNDKVPSITIALKNPNITEIVEGNNAVFSVNAAHPTSGLPPTEAINVLIEITQVGSFLANPSENQNTVSVLSGASADLTIMIEDDTYDENDGSVTATVLADQPLPNVPLKYELGENNTSAMIRITDNDNEPAISIEAVPLVAEGNDPENNVMMVFNVSLLDGNGNETKSGKEVKVKFESSAGTATPTSDFSLTSGDYLEKTGELVFAPVTLVANSGDSFLTIQIEVYGDTMVETNETLSVRIFDPTNATLSTTTTAMGSITEDDVSILGIAPESLIEGADGSTSKMRFTVTADPAPTIELTATWSTSVEIGNTATADTDFTSATGTITIEANQTTDTFEVDIIGDDLLEQHETFTIILSDASSGALISRLAEPAIGTIRNDDGPILSISQMSAVEGAQGTITKMTFTVRSTPPAPSNSSLTATWVTSAEADDTATIGTDFTSLTGEVTIAANEVTGTFEVDIIGDDIPEFDETFTVTLSNVSEGAIISDTNGSAKGRISNDDGSYLSITAGAVVEGNDGETAKMRFTVTATPPAPHDSTLTATWKSSVAEDDTATNNVDFTIATGSVTIAPNRAIGMFEVDVIGDDIQEPNETFTVTLMSLSDDVTILDTSASAKGLILDDDDSIPIVSLNLLSAERINEGDPIEIRISTRSQAPTEDKPIDVPISASQEGGNYITFRVPKVKRLTSESDTIKIYTLDDTNIDGPGTVTISIFTDNNYVGDGYKVDPLKDEIVININDTDSERTRQEARISVASLAVNTILSVLDETEQSSASPNIGVASARAVALPIVSVTAIEDQIDEGASARFSIVSRNGAESTNISISYQMHHARVQVELLGKMEVQIRGQNSVSVAIPTIKNNHADEDGYVAILLLEDPSYLIAENEGTAEVTVSDAIDRQNRLTELTAHAQALLPDLTGTMGANSLATISNRIELGFSENGNQVLNLGGQNLISGMLAVSGEAINENSTTLKSFLGDSSFAMSLISGDEFAIPTTLWGLGDYQDLSSTRSHDSIDWAGDLFTGHIGIDALVRDGLLTGISTSVAESKVEFVNSTTNKTQFDIRTTSLNPYIGWTSNDRNSELHATIGLGRGEFGIKQESYTDEILTSESYSIGLTGNQFLFSSDSILKGTTSLSIKGDTWLAHQFISGRDGILADIHTNVQHLGIRIEGSHRIDFATGSSLSPNVSIGLRNDVKDHQSVLGFELTSDANYQNLIGINIAGKGSMFIGHANQVQKIQLDSSLTYDLGSDQRGFIAKVAPSWGQVDGNIQNTIWSNNIPDSSFVSNQYANGTSLSSEFGYGLKILQGDGLITPIGGFEISNNHNHEYRLGTRVELWSNTHFELSGIQGKNSTGTNSTAIHLDGRLNW